MGMNRDLIDNNYIIVPQFLEQDIAINYANHFKKFCENNNVEGDWQVPTSSAFHNFLPFLELLIEKIPHVTSIVGEPLLPTYSYSRIYKNGNTLKRHTDRDVCEISLTVNLDCDEPWDIWIVTPKDEKKSVTLTPGDAMIYLGCTAPHWREEFKGNYCSQVFLHYVRSRGKYSPYFSQVSKL